MKSDIHISSTEKIDWIEIDLSNDDLFDVDYILDQYVLFWKSLETLCTAECCGLSAFSFYAEDVSTAAKHVEAILLKADLIKLTGDILRSDKNSVISTILNNVIEKTVFIKLLEHIIEHI